MVVDNALPLYISLFFIALVLAALFAYLETVFTSLRLFEVNQLEARVGKYEKLFAVWRSYPQRLIVTILIASNFADVSASVLITEIMQRTLGGQLGLAIGVFCATLIILLFGNIIPKSFGKSSGKAISPFALWFVNLLLLVFSPVVQICLFVANFFARNLGAGNLDDESREVTEQEIEFLIDYSDAKGIMEAEKTEMLQNVFELGQITVSEVMIPKNRVVMLDVDSSWEQVQEFFSDFQYSRIPLFDSQEDNIVGFVYHKDVFRRLHGKSREGEEKPLLLRDCMRPVIFVPESKKINQLLREFLKQRRHIAIVIDEYGSVSGLVTLEDVLEELVGEIRDENEQIELLVTQLDDGKYLIDGSYELKKLTDRFAIDFSAVASVSLGGFLAERLQRMPVKGDRIMYKGYCFQVQSASQRKVQHVLVWKNN